ncbi:helix-turn-helix domain-containing protein [Alkalihalobacterium bogoriense]|uniref:helix-turn-helix domain-containing protein n=1 Tax=Alkalihalobacterium bogoriense TaxID=246272 RepID=UPI000478B5BB|nr:helix-turn-helix domain-containing protein [Alkalihalobacterium bogoriense]
MSHCIRAVIVDDEKRIRRGIEKMVIACGPDWSVEAAYSDGQELVSSYDEHPFEFDVLITDIRMALMDGLTLIKEMKKRTHFYPLVISGYDDFSYLQTAIREGALDYLLKPIDRNEFNIQLEAVKQKIQNERMEKRQFEIMVKQASLVTKTKQQEKLLELTAYEEKDVSVFDQLIDFPSGIFISVLISVDQKVEHSKVLSEEDSKLWTFAHENILQEQASSIKGNWWKWKLANACTMMLFHSSEGESLNGLKQDVDTFSRKLQQAITHYTPLSNTIIISKPFTDITSLPSVKKDLTRLLPFRVIYGGNQTFFHGQTRQYSVTDNQYLAQVQPIIQKILEDFERIDKASLQVHILQFNEIIQQIQSPTNISDIIRSCVIQISSFVMSHTRTLEFESFPFINTMSNFSELTTEITNWIYDRFAELEKSDETRLFDNIRIVKRWVSENIANNITIEKVANEVYMNPTYFCEYFKQQTGETVLDYVTKVRMAKARELLLTTNLKVYEISNEVGYSDSKYFSKLFKKYYGEIPSKYKVNIQTRIQK